MSLTVIKTEADRKSFEAKAAREWSKLAQEPVTCEYIAPALYAFGSELACLRLFHAFADSQRNHPHAAYSENRATWYFYKECEV